MSENRVHLSRLAVKEVHDQTFCASMHNYRSLVIWYPHGEERIRMNLIRPVLCKAGLGIDS